MQPSTSSLKGFLLRNRSFFLIWATAALALRLVFLWKFRLLTNDSFVYGEIAKNWLQHGVYGQTFDQIPEPSFVRLPGYPMVLSLTWAVAGAEHYTAVLILQILVDILTCFLVADLARRIEGDRAAKCTFVLTASCLFFANYASVALTETFAIFSAALAFDSAIAALDKPAHISRWLLSGLALGFGILLRPDGGILLAVIGAYALVLTLKRRSRQVLIGLAITGAVALAPLVPWTIRNWRTFHLFQPLAPFYATMPWEFVPRGLVTWERTWTADYSSLEDALFKIDGEPVSIYDLPPRAWDNEAQRQKTQQLFEAYVANGNTISSVIDAQFNLLAEERIRTHPFRYYVGLPLMRAGDLWLRPRTEMLPIDPHWWRLFSDDPRQFWISLAMAALNLFYVIAAIIALARHQVRYAWLFLSFIIVRTLFLAWMQNPEPRYVLECYPAILAAAGAALGRIRLAREHSDTIHQH
jgi:4-amino-4-deoxy-L-arabinose transferase-like glycosyltransferase